MSASEQDRARSIHGGTRTLGVIGWPVEHSLSPAIHNAAFRSMGLPWVYLPLPVAPGTLPQALAGLVALGFEGANITMPHKTEAADLADELTEDARLLRAANTLTVQTGRSWATTPTPRGSSGSCGRTLGSRPAGRARCSSAPGAPRGRWPWRWPGAAQLRSPWRRVNQQRPWPSWDSSTGSRSRFVRSRSRRPPDPRRIWSSTPPPWAPTGSGRFPLRPWLPRCSWSTCCTGRRRPCSPRPNERAPPRSPGSGSSCSKRPCRSNDGPNDRRRSP